MADTDDEDILAPHQTLMASMIHPFEQILDADDLTGHAAPAQPYTPINDGGKTRDELLRDAFTDEALRRMQRKASVESATQKGSLNVNDELRSIADLMLNNLCEKAFILAEYHRQQTITASILRGTLETLDVTIDTYHQPRDDGLFPACGSHRKHTGQSTWRSTEAVGSCAR